MPPCVYSACVRRFFSCAHRVHFSSKSIRLPQPLANYFEIVGHAKNQSAPHVYHTPGVLPLKCTMCSGFVRLAACLHGRKQLSYKVRLLELPWLLLVATYPAMAAAPKTPRIFLNNFSTRSARVLFIGALSCVAGIAQTGRLR